jgi:hypothetical protein
LNIYNSTGVLVETIESNILNGEGGTYYQVFGSTAFSSELGTGYTLTIYYNYELDRWEMSYYNETLELNIVIGVLYGLTANDFPLSNCWDLDCIAVAHNQLGVFQDYFVWQGDYLNGRKFYEFTSDWSGPDINYQIYWTPDSSGVVGSGSPVGTPAWILQEETAPGVWAPTTYLFNDNQCPYGQYVAGFEEPDTRFSFTDLGVSGFDMKSTATDCGCCDTEVIVTIDGEEFTASVQYDAYGNILGYEGVTYYTFTIEETIYYLFFLDGQWVVKLALSISGPTLANLNLANECPFGVYNTFAFPSLSVKGIECFDCCDYYTPRNRNLLKKKKAIFVDEISSIRSKEIFGLKCGTDWDYLFKKHLIFDVLWCLPYGVLCEDDEQCLINNLNENCNC